MQLAVQVQKGRQELREQLEYLAQLEPPEELESLGVVELDRLARLVPRVLQEVSVFPAHPDLQAKQVSLVHQEVPVFKVHQAQPEAQVQMAQQVQRERRVGSDNQVRRVLQELRE